MENKGIRFNEGKTRHDLTPAFAQEQYARVLTKGLGKYDARNWENGMEWSKVLSSLERHLIAIKDGEDFDKETGLLHSAHIMCNAAFLTQFYRDYPMGDDRPHKYLRQKRIALDIDEVLADFVGGMIERFPEIGERSQYWNCPRLKDKFEQVIEDDDFWMGLKPKVDSIPFEPVGYITSRSASNELTKRWLDKHDFPTAPVYTVAPGESKIDAIRDCKAEIFVDDKFDTFVELNKAGICCFLMDVPHNRRYDVGFKRIKSLEEL